MPRPYRLIAPLGLLLLTAPTPAQQVADPAPTPYARAIAAGYKAAMYCSGIFNAGRTPEQIDREELRGIYAEYDAIVPTLIAEVDRATGTVSVTFDPALPPRRASWSAGRGCTGWPIGGTQAPLPAASPPAVRGADPRPWPMGDAGITPRPSAALSGTVAKAFDGASYGAGHTIGVVVLRDGRVVAERYADGWGPFVSNRTWSVAKSIAGTLVGRAMGERSYTAGEATQPVVVGSMMPPQWSAPVDPRRDIGLDNLLRMASGLHSDTAGNRTDAIYFGGVPVDEDTLHWPLEARPGTRFRYANNDILLAVLTMRTALGAEKYRAYPSSFFERLGMRHTVAEADWRGNFILSSQVWSTARDLARLGQFWLQDGVWAGARMLPAGWIAESIRPTGPQPASGPGYGRTLWLFGPNQGLPAGSYAAQGNRGQYVMVVPSRRLVIVRRGEDPAGARFDVAKFSADVIAAAR